MKFVTNLSGRAHHPNKPRFAEKFSKIFHAKSQFHTYWRVCETNQISWKMISCEIILITLGPGVH